MGAAGDCEARPTQPPHPCVVLPTPTPTHLLVWWRVGPRQQRLGRRLRPRRGDAHLL